tara:strand:+ start:217 stop:858 length:642 start_codon:yes stop_codon:yes gene_type:complete
MKVLLLGSIGVLAETSELQRQAYNKAFRKHGLDWYWSVANYCDLLKNPGGRKRLISYANSKISEPLIESIHSSKEEFFSHALKDGLSPREGLVACLDYCRSNDISVGLITTTTENNITALSDALKPKINFDQFSLITTKKDVHNEKPSSDIYKYALSFFDITAKHAIAIEDTEANQEAALKEQIICYLFAGEYAATAHNFNAINSLSVIKNLI